TVAPGPGERPGEDGAEARGRPRHDRHPAVEPEHVKDRAVSHRFSSCRRSSVQPTVTKRWGRSPPGRVGRWSGPRRGGNPTVSNLAQNPLGTAAKHGGRAALRMDDAVLTYGEFRDAAQRVAGSLRARGVSP